MREIVVEEPIAERVDEFRQVFAEIIKADLADIEFEIAANAILIQGLDLMMVEFFDKLDDATLRDSIGQFYNEHAALPQVDDVEMSGRPLVDAHVALSKQYPKQFFAFMFARLKATEWANARERFEQLFKRDDAEQNGRA
jgi:hypothetical protein